MEDDSLSSSSFPDHKLCGFLCVVLTLNCPPGLSGGVRFGTRFRICREISELGFMSDNGVVLSPVGSRLKPVHEVDVGDWDSEQCEAAEKETAMGSNGNCRVLPRKFGRRRKRSVGLVHGSISVVHQLHALVMHRCLMVDARLVTVEAGDGGETRALLLVDVYLPVALLSRSQFPKSGSVAGALFGHLRCIATSLALLLYLHTYMNEFGCFLVKKI